MAKMKASYRFLYCGYTIATKFCSYRVLDYWQERLEKENGLEPGSLIIQKITN